MRWLREFFKPKFEISNMVKVIVKVIVKDMRSNPDKWRLSYGNSMERVFSGKDEINFKSIDINFCEILDEVSISVYHHDSVLAADKIKTNWCERELLERLFERKKQYDRDIVANRIAEGN